MTVSGNVPRTVATSDADIDEEALARAALPESLRKALEDSPVPFMPSQVAAFLSRIGEAATLARMREIIAADTRRVYGPDHPAAKESKRA